IHLLNPGGASASVTVSLPGASPQSVTVGAGGGAYVTFPRGTIGGPVTVTSTQPVIASQRVQFNSTFNEVWSQTVAATASYFSWFDKASAGMVADNIHLDRKSTRLNSSHVASSYAVFCLKKKRTIASVRRFDESHCLTSAL